MSVTRTITGTKNDVIGQLREQLDYLYGRRDDPTLTQKRRGEFRGEAEGLLYAIRVLEDWQVDHPATGDYPSKKHLEAHLLDAHGEYVWPVASLDDLRAFHEEAHAELLGRPHTHGAGVEP